MCDKSLCPRRSAIVESRSPCSFKRIPRSWRSGIEAVISSVKRRFDMHRCGWKGRDHFDAKVLWSIIAYNILV